MARFTKEKPETGVSIEQSAVDAAAVRGIIMDDGIVHFAQTCTIQQTFQHRRILYLSKSYYIGHGAVIVRSHKNGFSNPVAFVAEMSFSGKEVFNVPEHAQNPGSPSSTTGWPRTITKLMKNTTRQRCTQ